jgi:hypothetical protein
MPHATGSLAGRVPHPLVSGGAGGVTDGAGGEGETLEASAGPRARARARASTAPRSPPQPAVRTGTRPISPRPTLHPLRRTHAHDPHPDPAPGPAIRVINVDHRRTAPVTTAPATSRSGGRRRQPSQYRQAAVVADSGGGRHGTPAPDRTHRPDAAGRAAWARSGAWPPRAQTRKGENLSTLSMSIMPREP